jgi:hypothetical protein
LPSDVQHRAVTFRGELGIARYFEGLVGPLPEPEECEAGAPSMSRSRRGFFQLNRPDSVWHALIKLWQIITRHAEKYYIELSSRFSRSETYPVEAARNASALGV